MAGKRTPNLVDQFKSAPSSSLSVSSVTNTAPPAAVAPSGGNWFQKNWGKAAAILIVVTITTIFIVRTVVVAKQKKRQKTEAPKLKNHNVEWESFFEDPVIHGASPRPVMHPMQQQPPPMQPHPLQPMHRPPPPQPPAAVTPGFVPLPPLPPQPQQPPGPLPVERGLQLQRIPPADGAQAGGSAMMPESSRPSSFTIHTDLPVVSARETDPAKRGPPGGGGEEEPMLPPDIEPPNKGTEFKS